MTTLHITTDVSSDRKVTIDLPPDTPLGRAELVVVVTNTQESANTPSSSAGTVRQFMGAINTGDPHSANNERIDADLAREYANELDD